MRMCITSRGYSVPIARVVVCVEECAALLARRVLCCLLQEKGYEVSLVQNKKQQTPCRTTTLTEPYLSLVTCPRIWPKD